MGWLDRLICPLIQLAEYIGATWIVTIWLGFFGAALLWATVLRFFRRLTPPGSGTIAAGWVGCVGIALLIYLLGIAVDPLLQTLLEQPAAIGDEKWNRIGFFEWKVLGGEWSWPVLPLTDFPQVGIVVHTVLWVGFILLIRIVLLWIYRDLRVGWATRSETLPFYYRWVGSSTARRADDRFKTWLRPLVYVLIPLHALAGYVLAIQSDGRMERANLACQEGGVALPTDIDLRRPETGGLSEELGRLLDDARGGSPEELQRFVTNAQEEMPELGRLLRDAQAGRPEGLEQFLREEGRQGNISELLEETGAEQALEDARGSIQAAVGESLGERLGLGPMPAAPPPGAWVLFGFLLVSLSVHLIIRGRPKEQPKEEKKDDNLDELLEPPPDPLRRLGNALQATIPGAFLESLEEHDAVKEERVAFSSNESPLVREAFSSLTGAEAPWAHQKEVLDHLASVWKMAAPELEGGAPTLEEVVGPSPVRADESGPPHALVLTPEGSGRTTLSCLLSLFVHLDRGATTLVVLRDRDGAKAWAQRFREALTKSSARWNVQVTIAGEDMSTALLAGRTPAVVVAGLEELETDVLQNRRTSAFFEKLGLIVADDVDRFTGVAEMHLHMVMRRIWTVLDTLHDAPYPTALLAIAGPSASGMEAWARHVLAAPLRIFDRDSAPRLTRALIRRRDLADGSGEAIPLSTLAEACDRASIPWHIRRAGDADRHLRRPETELGSLRRHHVADPADAEVVLIEGTYPEVRREADRLAHAGVRTDQKSVVLVLAPPADEEMVLHEEAADAPHRELIASLPRAVILSEPDVIRQRHFDRSLGREQDVEALGRRFGREFTEETLRRLSESQQVRFRKVWYFDPRADDAASRELVRAAGETALGEPIRATCVSESAERATLVDRGTSEPLVEVDRAIATAVFPPATIFLHPRGRYRVVDDQDTEGARGCEQITEPFRTTPNRTVSVDARRTEWAPRELGGEPLRAALVRGQVKETFFGVRRYGPGPELLEKRAYEGPTSAAYSTDICAISLGENEALSPDAARPLIAALRMILPCFLRGARELADVALADVSGTRSIVLFDRTPGASGFANQVHEDGLGDLLRLGRLVLERLVGPEFRRLAYIHDTSAADKEADGYLIEEALAWLARVLDAAPEEAPDHEQTRRGRRVEFHAGSGRSLGRLWISSTGRTDDLVWTRHRFRSKHSLGSAPAGELHIDVAVERRTIAYAVRRAVAAGAAETPIDIGDSDTWIKQHHAALATASVDLVALIDRLRAIAGPHYIDTALALVAGIPTYPELLPVAERVPLAVLARRRADRDAKILLAWAMLPTSARPTVRLTEAGAVLQISRGNQSEVVDLSGSAIRTLEGDTGSALALEWGESAGGEDAAASEGVLADDDEPSSDEDSAAAANDQTAADN